jgi:hypothetical protein
MGGGSDEVNARAPQWNRRTSVVGLRFLEGGWLVRAW